MNKLTLSALTALAVGLAYTAHAQVVREADTASLARVLDGDYDEFTFVNSSEAILFADLDAEIFQMQGRQTDDHHNEGLTPLINEAAAEEPGGCSDEGGPGGFCLQVFDAYGELLCWADRPMRPGWQRDPRLACPLFSARPEVLTLRVSARGDGENPCASVEDYPLADDLPMERRIYLLNVSLRSLAPTGPLLRAIGRSRNKL